MPERKGFGSSLWCKNCGQRAKTYYDREMFAVDGEGYVTDCGTGGCGFEVGRTRAESRNKYWLNRAEMRGGVSNA